MARQGVPVLLIMCIAGGADLVDGGREAGEKWIADYVGNCYHKTCDAWDPNWDLTGAVQDISAIRMIMSDLGNSTRWPEWKERSEFKAIRDRSAEARQQFISRWLRRSGSAASHLRRLFGERCEWEYGGHKVTRIRS